MIKIDDEAVLTSELDELLEDIEYNQRKISTMKNYLNIKDGANKIHIFLNCLLVRSLIPIILMLFFLILSALPISQPVSFMTLVGAIQFFVVIIFQMIPSKVLEDIVTIECTVELKKKRLDSIKSQLKEK